MWKKINLIVFIIVWSSCSYFKNDSNKTILKPYVEQYLNVFIDETERINPEENFITILTKTLSEDEYILLIEESSIHNSIYGFSNCKDTIFSFNYKDFLIIVIDKDKRVIENVKGRNIFIPPYNEDYVPICYIGEAWELRIKHQKLVGFPYKSEPYVKIFKRLQSIPISTK